MFLFLFFKERPLSLSWVPADVALVARFSSNRQFFNEMVLYREWVCEVEPNHDKDNEGNEKIQKAKVMSKQNFEHAVHFLADFFAVIERLTLSNFIEVECDRLISKIVVLSVAMVATSISSKIRKESTTFPEKKLNEKRG